MSCKKCKLFLASNLIEFALEYQNEIGYARTEKDLEDYVNEYLLSISKENDT